jgi:hypothetical protein
MAETRRGEIVDEGVSGIQKIIYIYIKRTKRKVDTTKGIMKKGSEKKGKRGEKKGKRGGKKVKAGDREKMGKKWILQCCRCEGRSCGTHLVHAG